MAYRLKRRQVLGSTLGLSRPRRMAAFTRGHWVEFGALLVMRQDPHTPMIKNDALLEWERAEIARSGLQAQLSDNRVTQTAPEVLARYANPPADAHYAWEYAFHLLGNTQGQRVLDFGCGDGQCTSLLASHGGRIAALDISTDLLG